MADKILRKVTVDVETKSDADLKKVGAWAYSEHPSTDLICVCYGIDCEPVQEWWPGKKLTGPQAWENPSRKYPQFPCDLYMAITLGYEVEAHNVAFEYSIWANILEPRYGWMMPFDHQWRDTMAVAAYYAMPQDLDKLSKVLGYAGKDPEGGRLITKYSKLHLKTAKDEIPIHDFIKFVDYCKHDVRLEQSIADELGDLPPQELKIFKLDQEINKRGIYLDEDSINDAIVIVEKRAAELEDEFYEITGLKPTQTDKVKAWLHEHGCPVENLQADYIEEVLDGDHFRITSNSARRALELRSKYNKASTKKLVAMLRQRGSDGRARFQVRYHGAATGRWTGTGFQPLNLSRGFEKLDPAQMIRDLRHRDPKWLDVMYGDAMEAVGKASRYHIRAEEGNYILAGDFVSIEAVLLSCLACEEWKVKAFRNKDPIYELMGCSIHNLPKEAVDLAMRNRDAFKEKYPAERFDGKTGELAFGYQGALGAWRKFDNSDRHTDESILEICRKWREKHPAIKAFWFALEKAAIRAVNKGEPVEVWTEYMPDDHIPITFEPIGKFLAMRLPNGKRIWYRDPELRMAMPSWHRPGEFEDCANGTCDCEPRTQLTYMTKKEGQWRRVNTYGGKLAENATQATSREVLAPAMLRLEDAGYNIILSVYDEIVCEMPVGSGSLEEFVSLMSASPGEWADEWPIMVDAWEGARYKK
jgi:DNA polymerase